MPMNQSLFNYFTF